jgi:hypothetical protein
MQEVGMAPLVRAGQKARQRYEKYFEQQWLEQEECTFLSVFVGQARHVSGDNPTQSGRNRLKFAGPPICRYLCAEYERD